jgi:hypothetical protein
MDPEELAQLQKRKIAVGTPMYEGKCHGEYAMGCSELSGACFDLKIPITFLYIYNSSMLAAARNMIVNNFLKTDFTHLIFIDSDTRFKALDVLTLALFDEDIITAPVMLKQKESKYNFELSDGEKLDLTKLLDVKHAGTGFSMIKRAVFENYRDSYPHLECSNAEGDKSFRWFDYGIRESDGVYLGEDVFFMENALRMGFKIKLCPWLKLGHIGSKTYEGDLSRLTIT